MIETTAGLVHRRGFHGTSLNEILTESGAPRGSLYYHFPGGKEELVLQATRQGVAMVTRLLNEVLAGSPDPADGVRAFVEAAAHMLRDSGYVFGCPVAPIVLDSPESSALAEVCQEALEEWRQVLVEGLGSGGNREGARRVARHRDRVRPGGGSDLGSCPPRRCAARCDRGRARVDGSKRSAPLDAGVRRTESPVVLRSLRAGCQESPTTSYARPLGYCSVTVQSSLRIPC
jgi:TetR/AcrR family transcriptional repressor of lmrAB and yxaGH operons